MRAARGPAATPGVPITPQRTVLPFTLVATMAASLFQLVLLAVLAAPLIDDVGLSRTELGVLGAVNTFAGALTSPFSGRLTDRLGARRSVVVCLWLSSTSLVILALAPNVGWMYVSSVVGGLPQGWGNPATNGLIATRIAPGRRGTLTGIKQSGVTFAGFLGGITLPALENHLGWRGAVWVFAVVIAAAAVAVRALLAPDPAAPDPVDPTAADTSMRPIPPVITWIAVYAFFMGLATGAVGRFLPLFAEESLGFSTEIAGLFAALGGLLGMAARIGAARLADGRFDPVRFMIVLSWIGASLGVLMAVTTPATRQLMWLTPPLNAIGTNAWNAVAMLAVITIVPTIVAGRASGRVMLGFLGGLAVSGPICGVVVDRTGDYTPVWTGAAVASVIAAGVLVVSGTARRPTARSAIMETPPPTPSP